MQKQPSEFLIKKALFNKIGYKPHKGQELIHFPEKPWVFHVAVWGRRSGKTLAAAMEAVYYLAQPNKRVWVVAPNYSLTEKVFREVYRMVVLENVLGDASDVVVSKTMGGNTSPRIVMKWGSWIEGKSADNPDSLVGEGLDFLIIDEAAKLKQGVYEQYLEPTLLDRKGKCLMITTPEGHNWLYHYWLRGSNPEDQAAGWSSSQFKSIDNPYLDKEWIENKKRELGGNTTFRQEYEASFEHHTGLVWPEFKAFLFPRGHLFDDSIQRIPEWWTHYRSIDIGLDNPFACLWFAVDPVGNVWVYDEYRLRDTLADVHAQNIKAKTRFRIQTTYIGHDATKKDTRGGKTVKDILADEGIYTYVVRPDKTASIQTVARYFRSTLEDHPKHPGLFIHVNCVGLIGELKEYVWDKPHTKKDRNAPDRPRDYKDDLVDCLRNFIQTQPLFISNTHLSLAQTPIREAWNPRAKRRPGQPTTGL